MVNTFEVEDTFLYPIGDFEVQVDCVGPLRWTPTSADLVQSPWKLCAHFANKMYESSESKDKCHESQNQNKILIIGKKSGVRGGRWW